ncbi:hypothetical protein L21SP5_00971 [Salinivirga cyanobacteriivorans]|uniref:Uncharacterized protein n=1 Tax=Salinivirga cyanobacteriivorans TaxID=1307839 RepID=A0A0S2HX83_9BACT|nr:hypothetical protein L21SP5_00971 [Salinivirga cyanobacteriivorans]
MGLQDQFYIIANATENFLCQGTILRFQKQLFHSKTQNIHSELITCRLHKISHFNLSSFTKNLSLII